MEFLVVLIGGLISFFSPCILPILPLYIGYLGNEKEKTNKKKLIINTIFFVLGISTALFLLTGITNTFSEFLLNNKRIFEFVSGIIILILAAVNMNLLKINALEKTYKIKLNLNGKMNFILAYILGFTFSFSWTPCVGPILSAVLLLTVTKSTILQGMLLMLGYVIGFTIPFIVLGIFTDAILKYINKRKKLLSKVTIVLNIILIIIGTKLVYDSIIVNKESNIESLYDLTYDFSLKDLNGNVHKLEEYKGKKISINYFSTTCYYCNEEMPDIQKLYDETGKNKEDVIVLLIASSKYEDEETIRKYIKENNYTIPTLLDADEKIMDKFKITAFPSTYVLDENGKIKGKNLGAMSFAQMKRLLFN